MIPENATEWYQFTCPRCAARWSIHYEVRRVTDDAGQVRNFYTSHGLPCESPVHAQAICTSCGHAPVHAELASGPPDRDLPAPAAAGGGGQPAVPRRYGVLHAWRRFTFEAVISLDAASPSGHQLGRQAAPYPAQTRALMVHVPPQGGPGKGDYLPAIITRRDEQPLAPGDSHVTVTISVPEEEASGVFPPGRHFALWSGNDVGHGTVLRRVLFD